MEHHPPDWLYQSLVDDTLPWSEAREISYEEFAERYTLHDSLWIGLFYDVAYEGSATLAIIWDIVWLPEEIARTAVEDPLLFIKIERVLSVSTSGYNQIRGLQRGIGGAEVEEVDGKNLMVVSDHYGGNVEISFQGKLKFLALSKDSRVLPL